MERPFLDYESKVHGYEPLIAVYLDTCGPTELKRILTTGLIDIDWLESADDPVGHPARLDLADAYLILRDRPGFVEWLSRQAQERLTLL